MAQITIGEATYDAFNSLDGANEYLAADILRASAWALLNNDAKGRALVSATRMMLSLPWCDEAPDPASDQATPIPEVCAMLAADLAANPKLFADASGSSNIKVVKAGSAQVEFFTPVEGASPIPKSLWDQLVAADLVCAGSDGDGSSEGPYVSGICGGVRPLGGRFPWDWPIAEEDYD